MREYCILVTTNTKSANINLNKVCRDTQNIGAKIYMDLQIWSGHMGVLRFTEIILLTLVVTHWYANVRSVVNPLGRINKT